MLDKIDNYRVGLIIGLIGPILGFVLYGIYYTIDDHVSFYYYVDTFMIRTSQFRSSIASLSLLFNLLVFLLLFRFKKDEGCRGILMGTAIYVPIILILYFTK